MDDLFMEIEEDLKHDRMVKLWKKYQNHIMGGIAALFVVSGAFFFWKSNRHEKLVDGTMNIAKALLEKDTKVASDILKDVNKNAPSKLSIISSMLDIGIDIAGADSYRSAEERLQKIVASNSVDIVWRDWATLSLAVRDMDNDKDSVIEKLEPLTATNRPFRLSAMEIIGYIASSRGDSDRAKSMFEQIRADKDATDGMKHRADLMLKRVEYK